MAASTESKICVTFSVQTGTNTNLKCRFKLDFLLIRCDIASSHCSAAFWASPILNVHVHACTDPASVHSPSQTALRLSLDVSRLSCDHMGPLIPRRVRHDAQSQPRYVGDLAFWWVRGWINKTRAARWGRGGVRRLVCLFFTHPVCAPCSVLSCPLWFCNDYDYEQRCSVLFWCTHTSTCWLLFTPYEETLIINSLCGWKLWHGFFFQMLPYFLLGIKLKTQLSVVGMSLRIGMRSPVSLTLKPRVGITLIAASHDSLNPQLSLYHYQTD